MNTDYKNLEVDADNNMSIEVVNEDFCESTKCQMPEMSIEIITNDLDEGTIPQMAIDSGINTGKLIGRLLTKNILIL